MIRRNVWRFVLRAGMSSTLAVAAILSAPAAANAGNMNGVCESGEFCVWFYAGYTGPIADMEFNEPNYSGKTFYNSTTSRNDNVRSAKENAFTSVACMYENANYSGHIIFTNMTSSVSDFGSWNDKASSSRFIYTSVLCN
ncbi:peptidase inhibitor family I36 protein [Micromonospora haikouensis]|uniref:peptidase inhibitor family I36 protein n=1 Tax=Micromonospora haikouensis TaxID=686309 RepID=UPI003D717BE7